jgi:hypothetical protein
MGWIRDLGSGKKFIPDPGFMGQKSPGSGSATLVYIYSRCIQLVTRSVLIFDIGEDNCGCRLTVKQPPLRFQLGL